MSGTSFDGVDVALIKTDGNNLIENINSHCIKYTKYEKELYFNRGFWRSIFKENYQK